MRASLVSTSLTARPGTPVTFDVVVTNTGSVIDGVTATVLGLDPAWVQLLQPVVPLFPDAAGTVTIRLDLPMSCPAGESMLTVRITSTIEPDRVIERPIWLIVEPVQAMTLAMRPSVVEAGSTGRMRAVLTNTGNTAVECVVSAREPAQVVSCRVTPPTIVVEPGASTEVTIEAHGPRPFFGQTVERSIQVTATTPALELAEAARFLQRPRIPRGVLTVVILALIIALWATIFLFAVDLLRSKPEPAKSVPATWLTGTRDVKLADIAATMTGTITAASTGEPLARVTVEAERKGRDGAFKVVASAATGEDGTYQLTPLLPGTYRVHITADGFGEQWLPPAAAPGVGTTELLLVNQSAPPDAPPTNVKLAATGLADGLDAVLRGGEGSLSGKIAAPPGAATSPATVTVTLIPANGTQPVPPPQTVPADGDFTVGGLPTPATYEVRIERLGFEPQVTRVELGGGAAQIIDTTNLSAADGALSGIVVDRNGAALGGVTLIARSGTLEKTVVTPTTGPLLGAFTIDGLPTPRTYVLTFSLDGYTSQTQTLDLGGGGSRNDITARLDGGAGTITGTVGDSTGRPLGGAAVVITRGSTIAQTATLTSGDGPNGTGSYLISGLPAPGTYALTVTLDGYASQTRQVVLDGTGPQMAGDVVLGDLTGTVSGTITLNGTARAGLVVELDDGTVGHVRAATTATTPLGSYQLADVPAGTFMLSVFDSGDPVTRKRLYVVLVTVAEGAGLTRDITVVT